MWDSEDVSRGDVLARVPERGRAREGQRVQREYEQAGECGLQVRRAQLRFVAGFAARRIHGRCLIAHRIYSVALSHHLRCTQPKR